MNKINDIYLFFMQFQLNLILQENNKTDFEAKCSFKLTVC